MPEEFTRRTFACMGKRLSNDESKLLLWLIEIDGEKLIGLQRAYTIEKSVRMFHCGARRSMEATGNEIHPSTFKWEGRFEGAERAERELDERAAEVRFEMLKRDKKSGEDSDRLTAGPKRHRAKRRHNAVLAHGWILGYPEIGAGIGFSGRELLLPRADSTGLGANCPWPARRISC